MIKQTLGEFLGALRKAHGYTQQEVAEKLNVSNKTLSSWENDRTAPDLLMLPAIADLYGVTIDELVRCEKKPSVPPEQAQLTEKPDSSERKSRYGKFIARCSLYTGIACLFGLIFTLAGILYTSTDIYFWASLLLWIAGGMGSGVFIIMIFYELNSIKTEEGIIPGKQITEESKAFALNLKRSVSIYLCLTSLPFLAGLIVLSGLCIDYCNKNVAMHVPDAQYNDYVTLLSVHSVLVAALLLASILYFNLNYKNVASEKQITTHKTNVKLGAKIFGFGAIPVAATFILAVSLFCYPPLIVKTLYANENMDEFVTHMQTLTVKEDDYFNTIYEMEPGIYPLNFPKTNDEVVDVFDIGYGFYCKANPFREVYVGKNSPNKKICIVYKSGYDRSFDFDANRISYSAEDGTRFVGFFVNAAYYDERPYDKEAHGAVTIKYCEFIAETSTGDTLYQFITEKIIDCYLPFMYSFIAVTAVAVPVCVTLYIVKRKKQNYDF